MRLDFNDGKYTYILHDDGTQEVLRYGEPWRKLIGDNLVYWMGVEVHNLRTENASLRAEVAQTEFRNERLVSDYASIQEELSTIRRIHVQNIAIKDAEIARWKTVPMKYRRMEFNAQLQEENASLKEQVVTLEKLQGVALIESLRAEVAERREDHMKLVEENHELRQQLAASQLEAKRLRGKFLELPTLSISDQPEWEMSESNPVVWGMFLNRYCEESASSPTSTDALDAYVAEKVNDAHEDGHNEGLSYSAPTIAELTRQRDLAVSAATKARNGAQQAAMVCPKKLHVYPALLNMIDVVDDALATIKES